MVSVRFPVALGHRRTPFSMGRRKSALNRYPGAMKAAEDSSFSARQEVRFVDEEFFFLTVQCADVIENKGRQWNTPSLSGNVYENKGDILLRREYY
ncbi:MAG: hypothetical protein ABSE93_06105 [Terriglobia bacterium]|jgi:hypothetical protein